MIHPCSGSAMRTSLLCLLLLLAAPALASAQAPADSTAIRQTALDYIEGWYSGDSTRMERALHPDLAKRIVRPDRETGRSALRQMTAAQLIAGTARGGGRDAPPAEQRKEVRILDVFEGAASVRVDAGEWIDYMHLARVDGEWKIVNVLWELRPRP